MATPASSRAPTTELPPVAPPPLHLDTVAPVRELPLGFISYQEEGRTYYRPITLIMFNGSSRQEIPSEMVARLQDQANRVAEIARDHFQGVINKQGGNLHDQNLLAVEDAGFVYRREGGELDRAALNTYRQDDDRKSAQDKWEDFKACVFGTPPPAGRAETPLRRSPLTSLPPPPPPPPWMTTGAQDIHASVGEHPLTPPLVLHGEAPPASSQASTSPPHTPRPSVWSTLRSSSAFRPVPHSRPVAVSPAVSRASTPSESHVGVTLDPGVLVRAIEQERLRQQDQARREASLRAGSAEAYAAPRAGVVSAHQDVRVPGEMGIGRGVGRALRRELTPLTGSPPDLRAAVRFGTPVPSAMEETD